MNAPGLTIARLADDIARRTGGRLAAAIIGDGERLIRSVAPLDSAAPDQLGFLANKLYRSEATATRAGAVVLSGADRQILFPAPPAQLTLIECAAPYAWYALAAQALAPNEAVATGIAPSASIDVTAQVDASASIGPHAVVGAGTVIGACAVVGAGAVLGRGVRIGAASVIQANTTVYDGCGIGARCIVHSGAVIGADGFGFAPFDGAWFKIPHTGAVRIGDDVEIGANTTIDRGAMADTVIEDGCKIDNQVQIGHNSRIGAHTVIAGCVGISGSATIGRHCMIGGAAGIAGHITIADGTVIGGGTAVFRSITTPGHYDGAFPMMQHGDWQKNAALMRQLDRLRDRIRELEKKARKD